MDENEKKLNSNRIVGNIIDQIIVSVIASVLSILVSCLVIDSNSGVISLYNVLNISNTQEMMISYVSAIINLVLVFVWFTIIPMFNKNKASIGKLIVGLKVIREDDKTPGFKNLLIRNVRLWIEMIAFIILLLQLISPIKDVMVIVNSIYGFISFMIYIYLIMTLSKGKTAIHDRYARTIVVDKLYDPNLRNYQTIEEVKEWADVEGFEKKDFQYNEEKTLEDKDPTDNDYWN